MIQDYAQRRQTVSEHQQLLPFHLVSVPWSPEREALSTFLLDEATRLEHRPPDGSAEAFLRHHVSCLPANSTLQRLASEHSADNTSGIIPACWRCCLRICCQVSMPSYMSKGAAVSALQMLKEPPGTHTPASGSAPHRQARHITQTGVLALELSVLNNNLQRSSPDRPTKPCLPASGLAGRPNGITVLVCFLTKPPGHLGSAGGDV